MDYKTIALLSLLVPLVAAGCLAELDEPIVEHDHSALTADNGLIANGITLNGITLNGITLNGITLNGITLNGITLNGFALNGITLNGLEHNGASFAPDERGSFLQVLQYTVECALRPDQSITVADGDQVITLHGALGLAPRWRTRRLRKRGQVRVSSCLMARVNALGETVQISLRGRGYRLERGERDAFTQPEGHFWGNLFVDEPEMLVCSDDSYVPANGRLCASENGNCGFTYQGSCADVCRDIHPSLDYWRKCHGGDSNSRHGVTVWLP